MMLISRIRRWAHAMSWLLRPWRSDFLSHPHRAITTRLGLRVLDVRCECGKVF